MKIFIKDTRLTSNASGFDDSKRRERKSNKKKLSRNKSFSLLQTKVLNLRKLENIISSTKKEKPKL